MHNCVLSLNYSCHLFREIQCYIKRGQTEYEALFCCCCGLFPCPHLIESTISLPSPCILLTIGENTADGNICKLCHRSHTITGSHVASCSVFSALLNTNLSFCQFTLCTFIGKCNNTQFIKIGILIIPIFKSVLLSFF